MEGDEQKLQDTSVQNSPKARDRVGFPQVKKEKKSKKGAFIFIILAILALVAVGVWLVFGKGWEKETTEEGPTPTMFEKPSSPTPTQAEIDRDEISIQILNGSGISGAAGDLKDDIEDLGYSEFEVGNASGQDYQITQVTFSSKVPQEVMDEITDELEKIYEDVDVDTGSMDEYDIEIITGYPKDYSPSPTEEPKATPTPTPTSDVTGTSTPTQSPTPTSQ